MSAREAARHFGVSRESVKKMLSFSVPPGYRRMAPIKRPKLDGFTEIIDQWLGDDVGRPRKQRHTAKRVFDRLRDGSRPSRWSAARHCRQDLGRQLPVPGVGECRMNEAPKLLLAHHLKTLKLPTVLREYDKVAQQSAAEGLDHVQFLAPTGGTGADRPRT